MTDFSSHSPYQKIIVKPGTTRISVVKSGPPGPPGPPGSNGAAIAYVHTQVTPSASWVINHNLNFHPNFSVEEAETGTGLEPAHIHHSDDQLELHFNTPRAGIARLS